MEKHVKSEASVICKSVFKNGQNTTTKSQYTKKWIELINKIERNKRVSIAGNHENCNKPILFDSNK